MLQMLRCITRGATSTAEEDDRVHVEFLSTDTVCVCVYAIAGVSSNIMWPLLNLDLRLATESASDPFFFIIIIIISARRSQSTLKQTLQTAAAISTSQ